MTEVINIVWGDIKIQLPANNPKSVSLVKKVLDIYLEDLLPEKRIITAKRCKEIEQA